MKQYFKLSTILLMLFVGITSCYEETVITVNSLFEVTYVNGDQSAPVGIKIANKTEGAETYEWTFEGANTTTSSDKNPATIVYTKPGSYKITLKASNADGEEDTFEKNVTILEAIDIDFSVEIIENNFSPVTIQIENKTIGENLSYSWSFEEGIPATSSDRNPENVVFEGEGTYRIHVKVSNGFESFEKEVTIEVLPELEVDFDWTFDRFDDDTQAPANITLENKTISATSYAWTFEGGDPAISSEENPKVLFQNAGTYAITLEASNDKQTKRTTKSITILPDTNLRTFEEVQLGINIAHNTNSVGAFFSSELRKTLSANEVTNENGSKIDIAFFGLNDRFNFNKFVSPDEVTTNGFTAIPNAKHTKFINSIENCNCGVSFTEMQFDTMMNDEPLQAITITETTEGLLHFNNDIVPRIILFQTADGRKGAIKIKEFIANGNSSYIICDIKIQKLP